MKPSPDTLSASEVARALAATGHRIIKVNGRYVNLGRGVSQKDALRLALRLAFKKGGSK